MRQLILLSLCLSPAATAGVSSETVYFLQPDGRQYLVLRAIHSDGHTHRFHLPENVRQKDLVHVSPARYAWNDGGPQGNTLSFDSGGFSLIYPGRFDPQQLQQNTGGTWRFTSWDGKRDASGRYGYWYAPGNFDHYTFTWVVPENIEVTRYRSNREGTWTRHPRAVSYYGEGVNNLTFEIDYRVHPADEPEPTPRTRPMSDRPRPYPVAPTATESPAAEPGDIDGDGVQGPADLCPRTPAGARVDRAGCALDADRDGVPDGLDRCLATPEGESVDSTGCSAS